MFNRSFLLQTNYSWPTFLSQVTRKTKSANQLSRYTQRQVAKMVLPHLSISNLHRNCIVLLQNYRMSAGFTGPGFIIFIMARLRYSSKLLSQSVLLSRKFYMVSVQKCFPQFSFPLPNVSTLFSTTFARLIDMTNGSTTLHLVSAGTSPYTNRRPNFQGIREMTHGTHVIITHISILYQTLQPPGHITQLHIPNFNQ